MPFDELVYRPQKSSLSRIMVISRIQPNGPHCMVWHQPSKPPTGLTAFRRHLVLVFSHTVRTIGLCPADLKKKKPHQFEFLRTTMTLHDRKSSVLRIVFLYESTTIKILAWTCWSSCWQLTDWQTVPRCSTPLTICQARCHHGANGLIPRQTCKDKSSFVDKRASIVTAKTRLRQGWARYSWRGQERERERERKRKHWSVQAHGS